MLADHEEEANKTRELAASAQEESEKAVESVQPVLDTLDRDLKMVDEVPVLQEQMAFKVTTIKKKSMYLILVLNYICCT